MVVPAVTAQSTPFMIYGNVFERDDNHCNGSTVLITNLNTGASGYAENSSGSHYFQQILVTDAVNVGDPLQFQVTSADGIQSNIVEHTVTAENVTTGGMFSINITLTYPDQQTWYLTSTSKPGDAPLADGQTHVIDNLMQKGSRGGSLGDSFNITYPEVAWFYADVGAESDIGFGENPWEAHIRTETIEGPEVGHSLTVEICRLDTTGTVTVIASHTEQFTEAVLGPYLWNITCEDNPATIQDFSTGDWLAVRISWDYVGDPLRIYYQPEAGMDSYIGSPYSDPGYPIPELSTMILFGMGLLMIVGYVGLRRRSSRSK
jgi:hypothetical protein